MAIEVDSELAVFDIRDSLGGWVLFPETDEAAIGYVLDSHSSEVTNAVVVLTSPVWIFCLMLFQDGLQDLLITSVSLTFSANTLNFLTIDCGNSTALGHFSTTIAGNGALLGLAISHSFQEWVLCGEVTSAILSLLNRVYGAIIISQFLLSIHNNVDLLKAGVAI